MIYWQEQLTNYCTNSISQTLINVQSFITAIRNKLLKTTQEKCRKDLMTTALSLYPSLRARNEFRTMLIGWNIIAKKQINKCKIMNMKLQKPFHNSSENAETSALEKKREKKLKISRTALCSGPIHIASLFNSCYFRDLPRTTKIIIQYHIYH